MKSIYQCKRCNRKWLGMAPAACRQATGRPMTCRCGDVAFWIGHAPEDTPSEARTFVVTLERTITEALHYEVAAFDMKEAEEEVKQGRGVVRSSARMSVGPAVVKQVREKS